ncbi:Ca-transporting ATPase [Suillus bovinus]|uniref:Ca-transporting ATPase n=1 Tax=Suillus bovinus TaxID=48563 RepID=UPI001B865BBF|nr:Ca-transporting ATPase [Suillus bovinus]KAG2157932.1 Ca-transporting ATPase [Suillus bovinus]
MAAEGNIPEIVTTDLSSNHAVIPLFASSSTNPPHRTHPDSSLLSPHPQSHRRVSLDSRSHSPSPTIVSSNDGASQFVPPSPTLSNSSSAHFATSLSLRDNKPDERNGYSSLNLLTASMNKLSAHRRKLSNATFTSSHEGHSSLNETEPDHDYAMVHIHPVKSDPTTAMHSPTPTHVDTASVISRSLPAKSDISVDNIVTRTPSPTPDPNQNPSDSHKSLQVNPDVPKLDLVQDDSVDHHPFKFKPVQLASLLDPKNLDALEALGGINGLLDGLGTHPSRGLTLPPTAGAGVGTSQRHDRQPLAVHDHTEVQVTDDPHSALMEHRKRVFGENVLPQRTSKSLLALMWLALQDKVLVLLSIAAVVSLALGLFQDFGTPLPAGQPPVDWVEGVAIMIAVLIVVVIGSINDWQKERQFKVLNEKKEERGVKVIRNGIERLIDVKEVAVGDVALLEPGEIIPCDGIFLTGYNVKCDESAATGESDAIKKASYADCLALKQALSGVHADRCALGGEHLSTHTDCFVVSGSRVLEGIGSYVVVAVGTKSFNGRIMMALRTETEHTPLQLKLNLLAELIAKIGSIAGIILFSSLMIRFIVQLATGQPVRSADQNGMAFVQILIISVTLVVVAVPEGLPLAVTLALAFATKRMTKENLLVRVLGSCETMGNASVICTDKTGTLTCNVMSVVAGSIGIHAKFVRKLQHNQARTNANRSRSPHRNSDSEPPRDDFSIDQSMLSTVLSRPLLSLFNAAIAVNSTAFEDVEKESGQRLFMGSKTETALLTFAKELGWPDYKETRDAAKIVQMIPFSSDRKAMGVVVKTEHGYRFHVKGASEILTKLCTSHVVVDQHGSTRSNSDDVEIAKIDSVSEENISRTIIFYANQTLRTIALCYKDFPSWPPPGIQATAIDEVPYDVIARDLTLIGIVGIEDPLRDGVREAVADCRKAGVAVKMCTGDNVLTARSIATQCGIYTAGGVIMEGPVFRQLDESQMLEIVPRLQVLARSSPEDKKTLVEKLRALGEIVAVTGDGTNDGPALKTANVGFSMGIAGTEVAKEASDIILMDDNFSSIVKAIVWGRCVNDAVRKFLQFQISTNVTAVVITSVTAIASSAETSALSAVQLLWINIIMDTFAALALATDPASPVLLDREPDRQTAPLFTVDMYKQILVQSIYQIIVILLFHFLGIQILGFADTSGNDTIVQTLVFNAFVFAQIFNSLNSRRLDRKLNIFEGMLNNWYFMAITFIEIAVQVVIVFIGGAAFQVTPIAGREWGISLALGFVSIPLGAIIRLLPNEPFERLFIFMRLLPKRQSDLPKVRSDVEWNSAIELVRDNLATFANLRGGRLRSSSFVVKSRQARLHDDKRVPLPSLMTMVPTLIASSIGAGWAPQSRGTLSDPARYDPSKSSAALWEGRLQIHPDTKPDDALFRTKWGRGNRPPAA